MAENDSSSSAPLPLSLQNAMGQALFASKQGDQIGSNFHQLREYLPTLCC
jgi:hypothetical protein